MDVLVAAVVVLAVVVCEKYRGVIASIRDGWSS
jgi:hypothetical protein